MIVNQIINSMDKDELRNYISHIDELNRLNSTLATRCTDLVRLMRECFDKNDDVKYAWIAREKSRASLQRIEDELTQKYEDVIAKPEEGGFCF